MAAKEYFADMSTSEFIGTRNSEAFEYDRVRNERTNVRNGIRVNVVDRPYGYKDLNVHVPTQNELLWPDGVEPNDERVIFEDLKVRPYVSNGRIAYSATAKSARIDTAASSKSAAVSTPAPAGKEAK